MNRQPYRREKGRADDMAGTVIRERFGQEIDSKRLSPLARQMATAIGDGTPAPWAGFVWPQQDDRLQQHLPPPAEHRRSSEAA
jgi:hypothetical protein